MNPTISTGARTRVPVASTRQSLLAIWKTLEPFFSGDRTNNDIVALHSTARGSLCDKIPETCQVMAEQMKAVGLDKVEVIGLMIKAPGNTRLHPGQIPVVTGILPGESPEEILITAHSVESGDVSG